jgi:ABC-type transport system substrate-binding protein
MVAPRTVGADVGSELASDFGCPPATTLVPDPPRSPTRLCNSTLQALLDELVRANPRPETEAEVEKILWQQLPALPLYQPVTLVASTAASDAVTGVGPGPIGSGPVTGAERWRPLPS